MNAATRARNVAAMMRGLIFIHVHDGDGDKGADDDWSSSSGLAPFTFTFDFVSDCILMLYASVSTTVSKSVR